MRIAIINEVSASMKNADIIRALSPLDAQIYNVGMASPEEKPELTYIHTGLMAAILLNAKACDIVVGGCGTGQGFLNSAMQYPNVFCGLITNPLDAWLFSQINGGNCVSLALNKGYLPLPYPFNRWPWFGGCRRSFQASAAWRKDGRSGWGYPSGSIERMDAV